MRLVLYFIEWTFNVENCAWFRCENKKREMLKARKGEGWGEEIMVLLQCFVLPALEPVALQQPFDGKSLSLKKFHFHQQTLLSVQHTRLTQSHIMLHAFLLPFLNYQASNTPSNNRPPPPFTTTCWNTVAFKEMKYALASLSFMIFVWYRGLFTMPWKMQLKPIRESGKALPIFSMP